MVKKFMLTFSMTLMALVSICIVLLLVMVPQEKQSITSGITTYTSITEDDYQFVKTKDVSKQTLVKEYVITSADIASFKKYNQYVAGNSDPFTPKTDLTNTSNGNTQTNTNNNTTNSNGGTSNPGSTTK